MVVVAQLVRASDCGSEGRRFEPDHPPKQKAVDTKMYGRFRVLPYNVTTQSQKIIIALNKINKF